MSASLGLTLEFRNGAQQLDLPDGTKTLFSNLQKAAKSAFRTKLEDGGRIMFQYSEIPECESFSKQFLPNKAQDILNILSLEGLKQGSHKISVPGIYGFGTHGPLTSEGYVGVAVLIEGHAEICIRSNSGVIFHHWESGGVLLLNQGTSIGLDNKEERQNASMETKEHGHANIEIRRQVEPDEERFTMYYTMFPVQKVVKKDRD